MYAIIESGGKQHRVSEGDTIRVEKLEGEQGQTVVFDRVLLVGGDTPKIGTPYVSGASVEGFIASHGRGEKVIAYKRKRRKGFHKKIGHRQPFTAVKIKGISA